jgi:hypothetical protein
LWHLLTTSFTAQLFQTIAFGFIQITAADHTKSLAVFPAQYLCRKLEKNIRNSNIIQFNALTLSHDILIVITAYRRNYNMTEFKAITLFKLLQASVADVKESEFSGIIEIYHISLVVYASLDFNR